MSPAHNKTPYHTIPSTAGKSGKEQNDTGDTAYDPEELVKNFALTCLLRRHVQSFSAEQSSCICNRIPSVRKCDSFVVNTIE